MAEKIPIRVQHKRMTASEWASSSLILLDGELGIESDTGKVKVGNGSNRFANLQYLTGPKGDRGERGIQGLQGNPGRDGIVTFQSLTQQEKESLKGAKGDRGEPGQPGERGTPGTPGRDGINGRPGRDGAPGQNIINQQNNQPLKYWCGTEAQFNAIPTKDPNTIYDVFK